MSPKLTLALRLTLGLFVTGCGPAVAINDESPGSTTTSSSSAGGNDGNPSVPPNTTPTAPIPTTGAPVPPPPPPTTAPPPSTTAPPTECLPGEVETCVCPGGQIGERECSAAGFYGACECESDTWGGTGSSTGWGSSGSSGGGGLGPFVPDLPPGETCLPPDLPCIGPLNVMTDADLEAVATCSDIQGDLFVDGDLPSLAPLGCLREVTGVLLIANTTVVGLDGLTVLESAGVLALLENSDLVAADIPTLEWTARVFLLGNPVLTTLEFASLDQIAEYFEAAANPMLPTCEIAALLDQTSPPDHACEDNLLDMCSGVCG